MKHGRLEGNIPSLKGNDPVSPIELPQSTFTDYRVYEKHSTNDAGYAGDTRETKITVIPSEFRVLCLRLSKGGSAGGW